MNSAHTLAVFATAPRAPHAAWHSEPADIDQFIAAIKQIDDFFVQVVRLPPR